MSGFQIWALHVKMQRNSCQKTVKRVTMNWPHTLGKELRRWGTSKNTRAHARARVTIRVPGAPSVRGQLCCLILCWMQLYLQPKGTHTAKVSKNLNLMSITLQAPLSPGVLPNIRLMFLKSWDELSILWTGRPQKRVRFPSALRHILTLPQHKCLVCSGSIHCSDATAADKVQQRDKARLSGGSRAAQQLGLPHASCSTGPQNLPAVLSLLWNYSSFSGWFAGFSFCQATNIICLLHSDECVTAYQSQKSLSTTRGWYYTCRRGQI